MRVLVWVLQLMWVLPPPATRLQAGIAADPALAGALGADVAALQALFANVTAAVDGLVLALSYASFHPVGREEPQQEGWEGERIRRDAMVSRLTCPGLSHSLPHALLPPGVGDRQRLCVVSGCASKWAAAPRLIRTLLDCLKCLPTRARSHASQ